MNPMQPPLEHVWALLGDRALVGADAAEQAGLDCLLRQFPGIQTDALDLTAAALHEAFLAEQPGEAIPAALLNRLQAQGERLVAEGLGQVQVEVSRPGPALTGVPATRTSWAGWSWAGWVVAAVVLLLVMAPQRQPNMEVAYRELQQRGALEVVGSKGPQAQDPAGGEILWDDKTQQGYMKLAGLPVNDPEQYQYQLWIFDERPFTEKTPIDGGVFNISRMSEVIVPIKANITVSKPKLFAITKERPGGVMVSERKEIVFVASVKK